MPYLTEHEVRQAAKSERRVATKSMDSASVLKESVETASATDIFDVFLCHAIRDSELVLGAKRILEQQGFSVYVDWIVDPHMGRDSVSAATADTLRKRMSNSKSLLYLFSNNSRQSRWMPWELGYFDGANGTVGILPIVPENEGLDFSKEEYIGLYPKVELDTNGLFVNRTHGRPVSANDEANFRGLRTWITGKEKLRM